MGEGGLGEGGWEKGSSYIDLIMTRSCLSKLKSNGYKIDFFQFLTGKSTGIRMGIAKSEDVCVCQCVHCWNPCPIASHSPNHCRSPNSSPSPLSPSLKCCPFWGLSQARLS